MGGNGHRRRRRRRRRPHLGTVCRRQHKEAIGGSLSALALRDKEECRKKKL